MSTLLKGHKSPEPASSPPPAAAGSTSKATWKGTHLSSAAKQRFETPEQKVRRQQSLYDSMIPRQDVEIPTLVNKKKTRRMASQILGDIGQHKDFIEAFKRNQVSQPRLKKPTEVQKTQTTSTHTENLNLRSSMKHRKLLESKLTKLEKKKSKSPKRRERP